MLRTPVAEEIEASADDEVVVCDRSGLENQGCLVARADRRPELDPLVLQWVRRYRALFNVPETGARPRRHGRAGRRDRYRVVRYIISTSSSYIASASSGLC